MTMNDPLATKLMDLARYHFQAGRSSEAELYCRHTLGMDAANAEARYLLSRVLRQGKRWGEATPLLAELATSFPSIPLVIDDYRAVLESSQLVPEGIKSFEMLCDLHPELPHLRLSLGRLYDSDRKESLAQGCFKKVLEQEPANVEALFLLGKSLNREEHLLEAENCLALASELEQERSDLLGARAGVLKRLGRSDEAAHWCQLAVELNPDDLPLYGAYLANFLCTERFTPEDAFKQHRDWAIRHAEGPCHRPPRHANLADPARRLRVGYVSADFRCHPVAFFIEPILSLHDRNAFDVYCYAQLVRPDYFTEQLQALPVTWRQISELSDAQVAEMIQEDDIDILVDLNGHTASSRVLIFARKPAPVQVTWLGYAHSTGLTSIDYRISDRIADPPGMTEHLHSERLYHLEGSFICYSPPQNPPPVAESPFLREGFVTFGVFNSLAKWNPTMLELWAKILLRVDGSRLLIKTIGLEHDEERSYLAWQFAALGVDATRLRFLKRLPSVLDHLAAVGEADIALDTFPYNGTTTTCESLFMGVPVVSLAGGSHVSRVGASILTHSGLAELVADTPERYLEIAVGLARQPEQMLAYRNGLRKVLRGSPFFDVSGFTKRLETGYRDMWHTWCRTQ